MSPTSFPEIPNIPEEIVAASKSGKLIIFVGAGVSRMAAGPSWNEMANKLLEELAQKDGLSFSFSDLDQLKSYSPRTKISIVMDIYRLSDKVPDFHKILHPNGNTVEIPKIYKDLYDLNVCFVTTNYDEWLDKLARQPVIISQDEQSLKTEKEQILDSTRKLRGSIVFTKEDLTNEKLLQRGTVIHLHGSIHEPKNMILTTMDYLEHYQYEKDKPNFVVNFLEKLFGGEYTVLFVGYGLEEDEILEYVLRKNRSRPSEKKAFRLFPVFSHQQQIFEHLANYSKNNCATELIPYSIDRFGNEQLGNVIADWSSKLKLTARDPQFLDKIKTFDEAFDE